MISEETVRAILEPKLAGSEIFLVEVSVKPGNRIRVLVDRMEGISIDECVEISRFLNGAMDRDVEDYALEVSSPGADSPFRVPRQYEKNVGRTIRVSLEEGSPLEGKLLAVGDEQILMMIRGKERSISLNEIKTAKAIITFN